MADAGRGLLAALVATALLAACEDRDPEARAVRSGAGGDSGLPMPRAAPGTSITGMPAPAASAAGQDADTAAIAAALPEGLEIEQGASIDPVTGELVPTRPETATLPDTAAGSDPSSATAVVREYAAALASGAFGDAQQAWIGPPSDGPVMELARGSALAIDVQPARMITDALGTSVVVPVNVHGAAGGGMRHVAVDYSLRRGPDGRWRIGAATIVRDEVR